MYTDGTKSIDDLVVVGRIADQQLVSMIAEDPVLWVHSSDGWGRHNLSALPVGTPFMYKGRILAGKTEKVSADTIALQGRFQWHGRWLERYQNGTDRPIAATVEGNRPYCWLDGNLPPSFPKRRVYGHAMPFSVPVERLYLEDFGDATETYLPDVVRQAMT